MQLSNVDVAPVRAEEAGRSDLRESFDVVVARAVGTLDWLAEWMLPLTKKGGVALAMKGAKAAEEMAQARRIITRIGGGTPEIHPVDLPGTQHHVIIRIPKIANTHPSWPRPVTDAKGRPPA